MFGSRKKKPDPDPRARSNVDPVEYKLVGGVWTAVAVASAPVITVVVLASTVLAAAALADAVFNSD